MKTPSRWLGIDFSGDFRQWTEHKKAGNVWVATVEESNRFTLTDLRQPQELEDNGNPFERLCRLLAKGDFEASAIDAPFSVPQEHVPKGSYGELLSLMSRIPCEDKRPFPSGKAFLEAIISASRPLSSKKPLRLTDCYWTCKGVNARSTLWNGARPGTSMTSACLTLLHRSGRPIWPWADPQQKGLLVEAFPAAQLFTWGTKFRGYDGPYAKAEKTRSAQRTRAEIAERLERRVNLGTFRDRVAESADALDAVLCCFAAIAATRDQLASQPQYPRACGEGWISVMRA